MNTLNTSLQAQSLRCDVLVAGAGPAGLSAALAAASGGARVLLLDDNPWTGGQIWRGGPYAELPAAAKALQHKVAASHNIEVLHAARVVGVVGQLADHTVLVETDSGALHVHWGRLVVCTGARERLLPFAGWTLPGVTGAGGLQALIKGGLPVRGQRVVIAGSGPLLFAVAASARKAGAKVLLVAEQASLARVSGFARKLPLWPSKLVQALQLRDSSYRTSTTVRAVQGVGKVQSVTVKQGESLRTVECDRVAVGYGLLPNTGLAEALGCAMVMRDGAPAIAVDALQATSQADIYAAGECTGVGGSERALAQGSIAGYAAIGALQQACALEKERAYWSAFAAHMHASFALDPGLKNLPMPETLVCRCEDVSHQALQAHGSWTEAKIHTRCGMGACLGKVCGSAAAFLYGWQMPEARLPLAVARVATLAASAPERLTCPDAPGSGGRPSK